MNIAQQDDEFSWKELNCFYRPFAIALTGVENKNYYKFLMTISFYLGFCNYGTEFISYNNNNPIFGFLKDKWGKLFNSECIYNEFATIKKVIGGIKKSIDNNYAVVVPIDLYELYYSQDYKSKHHPHYLLIYGYDNDKELYYIVDNMHIDGGASTKYTKFMIESHMLKKVIKSYCNYISDVNGYSLWRIKENDQHIKRWEDNFIKVIEELECARKIEFTHIEKMILNEIEQGNIFRWISDDFVNINLRKVYRRSALQMLKETISMEDYKLLIEEENKLSKDENGVKTMLSYSLQKGKMTDSIKEEINELERKYREYCALLLSKISIQKDIEEKPERFYIHNPLYADININKNKVEIKLDKEKTYDTWVGVDNACQILTKYNEKLLKSGLKIKAYADIEDKFHAGIIVKCRKGQNIMYGIAGNTHISIVDTAARKEHIFYFDSEDDLNSSYAIDVYHGEILFLKKKYQKEEWNIIFSHPLESIDDIEYMGIFAKTWEKCECVINIYGEYYREIIEEKNVTSSITYSVVDSTNI